MNRPTVVRTKTLGAAMVTLAFILTGADWTQAQDADRVDKTSRSSFSDTLKKLETALKSEGTMIVATIDHRNMLTMVGTKIRGATTIEFGSPAMGKMLLPMNAAIGLEMPAKIYVYETAEGRTILSYRKVAGQFATYGPEVAKAGQMMDMMLDKVTSAAAQ